MSYVFELANSVDLTRIADLSGADNKSLSLTLNAAGSFSFTVNLEDPISFLIEEIVTCVLVRKRNNDGSVTTVWSGPIWTIEEVTPNTMNVTAVGWMQTLDRRFIKSNRTYTSVEAGSIAQQVLAETISESQVASAPYYVFPGTYETTQLRTRTYKSYESALSIIRGLSDIEDGYDFEVDASTRSLNIYRQIGGESSAFFEYGINVASVQRTSDSEKLTNTYTAFGSTNNSGTDFDASSQQLYGIFDESTSLSDVSDSVILTAYASAEVAIKKSPIRIFNIIPMKANPVVPRLFTDFIVGDIIYFTINLGRMQASKQPIRVFGVTMSWDSNNNEEITSIQSTAQ